jgi:hypothetical protein
MSPTQSQFDNFEHDCIIAAYAASASPPITPNPYLLVHLHSSQARYAVFCAQYGSRQWPPHERASDDLGRPAYCQLKVMAIAAESCAELRPAYEGVVRKMLDAVEVVVDVEGGMRATADSLKQQEPELFSLNALLHEMGLAQLTVCGISACQSAAERNSQRRPHGRCTLPHRLSNRGHPRGAPVLLQAPAQWRKCHRTRPAFILRHKQHHRRSTHSFNARTTGITTNSTNARTNARANARANAIIF